MTFSCSWGADILAVKYFFPCKIKNFQCFSCKFAVVYCNFVFWWVRIHVKFIVLHFTEKSVNSVKLRFFYSAVFNNYQFFLSEIFFTRCWCWSVCMFRFTVTAHFPLPGLCLIVAQSGILKNNGMREGSVCLRFADTSGQSCTNYTSPFPLVLLSPY